MDGWQVVVFTVALMLIGIDDMQVKCFVMQSGMDILFKIEVLFTKWSMNVAPFYDTPFSANGGCLNNSAMSLSFHNRNEIFAQRRSR